MHASRIPTILVAVSILGAFVACRAGDDEPGASEGAVIGGVDARGASLDAIGALVMRSAPVDVGDGGAMEEGGTSADGGAGTGFEPFCTGTLIAPRAVLTAKHCVFQNLPADPATGAPASDVLFHEAAEVRFAIGHDARAPKRTVAVESVELCNAEGGGFANLGCDVAVYHLKEDVEGVTPIPFSTTPIDDSIVGQKRTAVGYGIQDARMTAGTRKAGSITVRATRGAPLQAIFPTFDSFLEAYRASEGAATTEQARPMLEAMWLQPLFDGYELWAGNGEGDAQICDGDSGGPLLAKVDGKNVVIGVASTAVKGIRLPCNLGGSYATFGPKAREILDRAVTDPCEGVAASGRCDGTVAVRCTNATEGVRRLTRIDCSDLNQRCDTPDAGQVECVD